MNGEGTKITNSSFDTQGLFENSIDPSLGMSRYISARTGNTLEFGINRLTTFQYNVLINNSVYFQGEDELLNY